MAMKRIPGGIALALLAACASDPAAQGAAYGISLDAFHSDDPMLCKEGDVSMTTESVAAFLQRARPISPRELHDHYDLAPCYREGRLTRDGVHCTWRIRPGGIGSTQCGDAHQYLACDDCEDLYLREAPSMSVADPGTPGGAH